MEFLEEEQNVIRRYLLGDLDEEQRRRLEERLFTSPAFKTQVQIAEDELAEDYLAGRLPARDQDEFRRRLLLTGEQNRRIEVITALRAFAAQRPPSPMTAVANDARAPRPRDAKLLSLLASARPQAILAAATIVVIVAVASFWILRYSSKTRPSPDELTRRHEIEREVSRLNPPGGQPLPPELTAPASHISSVTLNPNVVRRSDGELTKVEIPNNVTIVQLRLKLPPDGYDSYRLALYTNEGIELLSHNDLTPQTLNGFKDMIFNLPSSVLSPGDYQLRLSGRHNTNRFEEVADYNFRVAQHNSR